MTSWSLEETWGRRIVAAPRDMNMALGVRIRIADATMVPETVM